MSDALDGLRAMRARLAKPEAWSQHHSAIDSNGHPVLEDDKRAVAWSLSGALWLLPDDQWPATRQALLAGGAEEDFRDWEHDPNRTHADVLALLDRAIAAEEPRP